MIAVFIGIAIIILALAMYANVTGNDPLANISNQIVSTLLLPIEIPVRYMARALYRLSNFGGPIAVLGFDLLYIYIVIAAIASATSKRNAIRVDILKYIVLMTIIGIIIYRIRWFVSHFG